MAKVYVVETDQAYHKTVEGIYGSLEAAQKACTPKKTDWQRYGDVWVGQGFDIYEVDVELPEEPD